MIDIKELTDKDTGKWVLFKGHDVQPGRIKAWNDNVIYVVFSCDRKWGKYFNYTGEGCKPDMLTLLKEVK